MSMSLVLSNDKNKWCDRHFRQGNEELSSNIGFGLRNDTSILLYRKQSFHGNQNFAGFYVMIYGESMSFRMAAIDAAEMEIRNNLCHLLRSCRHFSNINPCENNYTNVRLLPALYTHHLSHASSRPHWKEPNIYPHPMLMTIKTE